MPPNFERIKKGGIFFNQQFYVLLTDDYFFCKSLIV